MSLGTLSSRERNLEVSSILAFGMIGLIWSHQSEDAKNSSAPLARSARTRPPTHFAPVRPSRSLVSLLSLRVVQEPACSETLVALGISIPFRLFSGGMGVILRARPSRIEVRVHLNHLTLENSDFMERAVIGRARHNLAVLSTGLRRFGVEHVESTESGHVEF
jgi:hypothetical protein